MNYSYKTLPQLIELLDQHFQQIEPYRFEYHMLNDDVIQYLIKDKETNQILDQSERSIYAPEPLFKKLNQTLDNEHYINQLKDQLYNFRRDDIELPSKNGNDIILGQEVMITDPCYDEDTWCNGKLTNVRPGIWHTKANYCNIEFWGDRCTSVVAWHQSVDEPTEWEITDIDVGVDSGQAGIIDLAHFHDIKESDHEDKWYDSIQTYQYGRQPITPENQFLFEKLQKLNQEIENNYFNYNIKIDDKEKAQAFLKYLERRRELDNLMRFTTLDEQSFRDHTQQTCTEKIWTDTHSVITSSGFGDGSYNCLIAKDKETDQIIGIKIDYVYDSDEE